MKKLVTRAEDGSLKIVGGLPPQHASRTIAQVVEMPSGMNGFYFTVLATDGTIWSRKLDTNGDWIQRRHPPLPPGAAP